MRSSQRESITGLFFTETIYAIMSPCMQCSIDRVGPSLAKLFLQAEHAPIVLGNYARSNRFRIRQSFGGSIPSMVIIILSVFQIYFLSLVTLVRNWLDRGVYPDVPDVE